MKRELKKELSLFEIGRLVSFGLTQKRSRVAEDESIHFLFGFDNSSRRLFFFIPPSFIAAKEPLALERNNNRVFGFFLKRLNHDAFILTSHLKIRRTYWTPFFTPLEVLDCNQSQYSL